MKPKSGPTRSSLHTTHFHPPSGAARHTSERATMQQNAIDTNLPAFRFCSHEHANLRAGQHAPHYTQPTFIRLQVQHGTPQSGLQCNTGLILHLIPLSGFAGSIGISVIRRHRRRNIRPPAAMPLLLALNLGFKNSRSQSALRFCRTPALAYTPASASRQGWRATPKGSPTLPCAGSDSGH